jgi:hypothetical protein
MVVASADVFSDKKMAIATSAFVILAFAFRAETYALARRGNVFSELTERTVALWIITE